MLTLRKMASFMRWRLVVVRYLTMLPSVRLSRLSFGNKSCTAFSEKIAVDGYHPGSDLTPEVVEEIREIYVPRTANAVPTTEGSPFTNLFISEDIRIDNPVVRLAFSKEILDLAADYYAGAFHLSTIQVLYAWPSNSEWRESQKWHRDYSDTKSLHCMIYLNDVISPEDGPFVFVDKDDSSRIHSAPIVRRIDDQQFSQELGSGVVRYFYGKAGSTMFVDPSPVYHYAHRTNKPHLGIFVTFNTLIPYAPPIRVIRDNASKLLEIALKLRPDLSKSYLERLLQLD